MKTDLNREELKRCASVASRKAIGKANRFNIPFTVQEGRNIVKIFPDGKKETVGYVDKAFVCLPKKKYKMA